METKHKIWVGIGAVLASGSALHAAADMDSARSAPAVDASVLVASAGEAGEAGEGGEGGEGGEQAGAAAAVSDDTAYRSQLALVRGHLLVGMELYQEDAVEAAKTHMKHPEDELYAGLVPALEARDAEGFAGELEELAQRVEAGAPVAEVESAYEDVIAAVGAAEDAAGDADAQALARIIVNLVTTAAEEYDIAVGDDGAVTNAHEYQDALGFVRIAGQRLDDLEAMLGADDEVVMEMRSQLEGLESAWPSLVPPESVSTDPARLYAAASRLELAASSL